MISERFSAAEVLPETNLARQVSETGCSMM
jgi:hypothetical protein